VGAEVYARDGVRFDERRIGPGPHPKGHGLDGIEEHRSAGGEEVVAWERADGVLIDVKRGRRALCIAGLRDTIECAAVAEEIHAPAEQVGAGWQVQRVVASGAVEAQFSGRE